MEVSSKENIIGLTSNRSIIKGSAVTAHSTKKPTSKKALADVGNILNSTKKRSDELSKPGFSTQKLESTKNFKIFVEEKDVIFSPAPKKVNSARIPLSPVNGVNVTGKLNPKYQYDDDLDSHAACPKSPFKDELLPRTLRVTQDDFDSLAMLKPSENDVSLMTAELDLNDTDDPFLSFASQSVKKPATAKKALADVGNLQSANKNSQEIRKPGFSAQKLESSKNFKIFVEDKEVMFSPTPKKPDSERIPLSPNPGVKVATKLNPKYYYDDGPVAHDDFCNSPFDDEFLPASLRFQDDDFKSLALCKPSQVPRECPWKSDFSALAAGSDSNVNVSLPSPVMSHLDIPFDNFLVPKVDFDDSF